MNAQSVVAKFLKSAHTLREGDTRIVGNIEFHLMRDYLVVRDLTLAGRKGKTVPRLTIEPAYDISDKLLFHDLIDMIAGMSNLTKSFVP